MEIRPIREEELALASALVAEQQAEPSTHICYLSPQAQDIAEDLRGLDPIGIQSVLVAVDGDRLLGLLGAEWDEDPPRVWWWGPFVFDRAEDPDNVANALLDHGHALLPDTVTQEELGPDDRNTFVAELAQARGFEPDDASVVLTREALGGDGAEADGPSITPFAEEHRQAVAALHEHCFAGAHLPGERIDEGEHRLVLVATDAQDGLLGYVAANRETDGSGYIDFVGVAEEARGRGIGGALVESAAAELNKRHGCETINLTVREHNTAARRLYARLGFTEERLIRPWRLGFSISRAPAQPEG